MKFHSAATWKIPQRGYLEIVERWRQLPDGLIEFTVRHLPTSG
jgi:hypothetical protein